MPHSFRIVSTADDLFQQTAMVLWRKHEQFDPSREFLPWALGIAHNEVRRFFRRRGGQGIHLSDALMERLAELRYVSENTRRTAPFNGSLSAWTNCRSSSATLSSSVIWGRIPIKTVAEQQHLEPATLYKRLDRIRWGLMDCVDAAERREAQP